MFKKKSLLITAIIALIAAFCSAFTLVFTSEDECAPKVCVTFLILSLIVLAISFMLLKGIINLELKVKNKIIKMNSDGIEIIEISEIVVVEPSKELVVETNSDSKKQLNSGSQFATGTENNVTPVPEEPIIQKPVVTITTKQNGNCVLVNISSNIKEAEIVYKINNEKGLLYQNEFCVFENCKITAGATYKNVKSDSVEEYVKSFVVANPSICVNGKTITLNCNTPNSEIYYSIDGKDPSKSSILYTGEFSVKKTCIVKAIAYKDNYKNSDICTEEVVVVLTKKERTRLFTNEDNVIGISYRGNSHIKSDTPCQDCHAFSKINDDWSIAIVSDGAGSAKNSDQGSRAVCAAFKYYIENLIAQNSQLKRGEVLDEKTWDIEFKGMINQFHKDLKDNFVKPDTPFESFAATIIILLFSKNGYMFAHVGDGRAAVRINGEWITILTPHKGSEANQTIFSTSQYLGLGDKARPNLKMSGVYVPETKSIKEKIDGFVLMSDGCENGAWFTYQRKSLENGDFYVEDVNLPRKNILDQLVDILRQDSTKREESMANFITEYNDAFENEPDDKTILIGIVK